METFTPTGIRGIVFDLDGTLYVCDRFAAEIQAAAALYIAGVRKVSHSEAELLMAETRNRLTEESGNIQTISAICTELGGSVREMHRFFEVTLRPEAHLLRDERVVRSLQRLGERFQLYIYTNNNRVLTTRIMNYLGLDSLMDGIFTIDDTWRGKPDEEMIGVILEKTGLNPDEALFVGDRYDIDLRVPEQLGCQVYLSQTLEQLLRLEHFLMV